MFFTYECPSCGKFDESCKSQAATTIITCWRCGNKAIRISNVPKLRRSNSNIEYRDKDSDNSNKEKTK